MSSFKSKKTIISWLRQRKYIKFSYLGFTWFYKMNSKGEVLFFKRSDRTWAKTTFNEHNNDWFIDVNKWFKTKKSEVF
jgi:hypothetical protein